MSDKFRPNEPGLLVVFMEPGELVNLTEFHEWYDSEHVPLRIERFPTFRSAVRYSVPNTTLSPIQGNAPGSSWGAFYTISDNSVFSDSSYTNLRSQRSQREAELFTRLAIIDRRIYKLEYDSDWDDNIKMDRKKLGLKVQTQKDTPRYLVTNSIDIKDEWKQEYDTWFQEEHVPMLSKIKGWRRSRRFTLVDNGVNGREAKPSDADNVPKVMGMHEESAEFKAATNTPWRTKVMGENNSNVIRRERKVCTLYRAWDPIAALNADQQVDPEQAK
ncbi:uncharacterized protein UTRI_00955 [Ustilago trichophora]|uniref:EthD domain-containing protein n=1 Tax=Ustilago trichophora TaxID=86804 RepID=A0A5C3DY62_9BASI|nr:uncharacterized protein UTRI_00955 [Ustilago trichophora]